MADYKINSDIRQRHLEAWELAYKPGESKDGALYAIAGLQVRACIEAGILEGLTVDDVGEMTAEDIAALSEELSAVLTPFYRNPENATG
jgi:hypothetical protein